MKNMIIMVIGILIGRVLMAIKIEFEEKKKGKKDEKK